MVSKAAGEFDPAPQDLVLTLLGARPADRRGAQVWSGGLVALLAEFGFSPGAARIALARMVHSGLLARVMQGRLAYYTPTPRTVAVLDEGDRRIFSLGRQRYRDTTWTVLWQAIPDDERLARERLVRRLRFLGFGSLQDGTWIAAHDRAQELAALLEGLGISRHTGVFVGQPAGKPDFHAVIARLWDLAALAARYRVFVAEFGRYARDAERTELTDRHALLVRTRLVHMFRQFPLLDPELPENLAPPPDGRAEAVALFHELYPALSAPAQRHFNEVTTR